MPRLMISYSRKDEGFVKKLDSDLQQAGLDMWLDTRDILPGEDWRQSIFRSIVAVDAIILCLSQHYMDSEICQSEAFLARCYQKRLLPIILDNRWMMKLKFWVTVGLENIQSFPFFDMEFIGLPMTYDDMIQRLLRDMKITQISYPENSVYFAYPSKEALFATRIADALTADGIATWIGTRDSIIGFDWQQQQWKAMMNARLMVVILTPDSAASEFVRRQILFAQTRGLPILPVLPAGTSDDLAAELARTLDDNYENRLINCINWLYTRPDFESMLVELKQSVERILSS